MYILKLVKINTKESKPLFLHSNEIKIGVQN